MKKILLIAITFLCLKADAQYTQAQLKAMLNTSAWPFRNTNTIVNSLWLTKGNAGTNSGTNFLGTTDNISLVLRTNNTLRLILDSTGFNAFGKLYSGMAGVKLNITAKSHLTMSYGFRVEDDNNAGLFVVRDDGKIVIGSGTYDNLLNVYGTIKINDGTQGANKVLTSDANGVASWQNPDNVLQKISSTTAIDIKTVAITTLYTVPAGKTLILTDVIIKANNVNTETVAASLAIGGNSATYNDWQAASASTTGGGWKKLTGVAVKTIYPTGTVIKINVTVGATATTDLVDVDLIGYLY